jgi:lamin tail-like protein
MRLASAFTPLLAVALALIPAPAPADSPLRLNEILPGPGRDWDGSGAFSSRDDEWVEVLNASDATLDLTGYFITDADSIPRFAFAGTLDARLRLVVFGGDAVAWEHATGFPAFGLSLGNSGDAVLLWRVIGPDTTLVDSYAYTSHEAAADRSIGRVNDEGAWELFDGLNPYTGTLEPVGNHCNPSPDALNACGVTPARPPTWGRIKSLYR